MGAKRKLAVYWASGCGGCDIALLELHERLLDVLEAFDVVFWPCVMDAKYEDVERMPEGDIDVCLVSGAVRTAENREILELLRSRSKTLVAFGACAVSGGIPGLANLSALDDILTTAFGTDSTEGDGTLRPQARTSLAGGEEVELTEIEAAVRPIRHAVDVDYGVPGCPPQTEQVWAVCSAVASGDLAAVPFVVGAGAASVCDECPLEKRGGKVKAFARPHEILPDRTWCLFEQGLVCSGPVTRSGCEARCPSAGMPCRGCYGPAGDTRDQGAKMIAAIGSMIDSEDETEIRAAVTGIVDPVGSFYRFTLPDSILGRARRAT